LAGHLGLGKLIYLYDDNGISIDGSTSLTFTEDVALRFEAFGWHVQKVDGMDPYAVSEAITLAKGMQDKPSLIMCKTIIGFGSPNKAGSQKSHGAPLGVDEVKLTKEALGIPLEPAFYVSDEVAQHMNHVNRGQDSVNKWNAVFDAYAQQYPAEAQEYVDRMNDNESEKVKFDSDDFEEMKKNRILDQKCWSIFKEVFIYVAFVCVLCEVAFSNLSSSSMQYNFLFRNNFVNSLSSNDMGLYDVKIFFYY
jgi:transketolase